MKHMYSRMVRPYEKSVFLGGSLRLFPVAPDMTKTFAEQIRLAIQRAEQSAYERGAADARAEIKKALRL